VKTIEFISVSGQDEVAMPDVGLVFNKNISEGPNAKTQTVSDEDAAILLTNVNFRDVDKPVEQHEVDPPKAEGT
jgi:hypothetical protein